MFLKDFLLKGTLKKDTSVSVVKLRLLDVAAKITLFGCVAIFIAMTILDAPNYLRGLYFLPFVGIVASPQLLPFQLRTMFLIAILVFAGVLVAEGRMEPIGGRIWVVFAASLAAVLFNLLAGSVVLILGSMSLFTPYVLLQYGVISSTIDVAPLRDWMVQIVTGLLPGFLSVFSFGLAFEWLIRNEEKYKLVTDNAVDVIWTIDRDLVITFVSPSVKKVFGFDVDDLLGQPGSEITGEFGVERMQMLLTSQHQYEPTEIKIKNKQGDDIWVESASDVMKNAAGEVIGISGIFRDVSSRHEARGREELLEHQLRQSQKMESIGRLAGGIAHDFNNILGVIMGYTEIIKSSDLAADELDECVDEIAKAGSRAANLTNQLLLFSRKQSTQFTAVNCNVLLDNIQKMLDRLLPESVNLEFNKYIDLPDMLADAGQIEQVVVNLVMNAKDAMPNGGCITLETDSISIDETFINLHPWARKGEFLRLKVIDTGLGMSEEIQAHIFEPFFTSKSKGEGTGLGLAVIFGIVNGHNGFIYVDSEEGRGSEFHVYLPTTSVKPEPQKCDTDQALVGGDETILVIEDNAALIKVAERILGDAGYNILAAKDGEVGILIFNDHATKIDLVFTDMVLPTLSGEEVYNHVRRARPNLPVLYCSGYSDAADQINKEGELEVRVLVKPYGADTLLRAIRASLDTA